MCDLETLKKELEAATANVLRWDGICVYLRGKIQEAETKALQKEAKDGNNSPPA